MKTFLFVLLFPVFALAAPGDAVYVVDGGTKTLSSSEKLSLASAVTSVFPSVPIGTLDTYHCFANPGKPEDKMNLNLSSLSARSKWTCRAVDETTGTDAQILQFVLEEKLPPDAVGAGNSINLPYSNLRMDEDAKILNEAFTQDVFSVPLSLVWEITCKRVESDIECNYAKVKVASESQFKTDYKAKIVLKAIGRVAP